MSAPASVSNPPAIETAGLRHAYGTHTALDGVDLRVDRGGIFGLLGPNGGGKTTLFRVLATLVVPGGGSARVFGIDVVAHPHEVRRRTGVVFQTPGLDLELTSRENLAAHGALYGLSGAALRKRSAELLERGGLTARTHDRAKTLSGGLRRRLEIAKVLLTSPQLLLLDEPSAGLDPGARRDLWDQLAELKASGVTVFVTTHLMEEAERCDRLAILDLGRVVAMGTPAELAGEIGGDVVTIIAPRPRHLAANITARLGVTAELVDGTLRIERERGHELVAKIVEAFRGDISSVTLRRPTLEDVFIRRTGHRFWGQDETDAAPPEAP